VIARSNLSKEQACEIEIAFIAAIGREIHGGPLVNMTDGGDGGTPGAIMSSEWRANRSLKAKEKWTDPEYRAKNLRVDRYRSGNKLPRTEQFKAAVAEKMKGNTHTLGFRHSDSSRAKMSADRKGVPKTPAHRAAISAALSGRTHAPMSEVTKLKLSRLGKGRTLSPETRAKISVSKIGWRPPPRTVGHQEKINSSLIVTWASAEKRAQQSERQKLIAKNPDRLAHLRAASLLGAQRRREQALRLREQVSFKSWVET